MILNNFKTVKLSFNKPVPFLRNKTKQFLWSYRSNAIQVYQVWLSFLSHSLTLSLSLSFSYQFLFCCFFLRWLRSLFWQLENRVYGHVSVNRIWKPKRIDPWAFGNVIYHIEHHELFFHLSELLITYCQFFFSNERKFILKSVKAIVP